MFFLLCRDDRNAYINELKEELDACKSQLDSFRIEVSSSYVILLYIVEIGYYSHYIYYAKYWLSSFFS